METLREQAEAGEELRMKVEALEKDNGKLTAQNVHLVGHNNLKQRINMHAKVRLNIFRASFPWLFLSRASACMPRSGPWASEPEPQSLVGRGSQTRNAKPWTSFPQYTHQTLIHVKEESDSKPQTLIPTPLTRNPKPGQGGEQRT